MAVNPFLALMWRWSHEHIVFTSADKAYLLYGGFISTFLVQAFLFDADTTVDQTFQTTVENTLIGALFANVVLFPIQYVRTTRSMKQLCFHFTSVCGAVSRCVWVASLSRRMSMMRG